MPSIFSIQIDTPFLLLPQNEDQQGPIDSSLTKQDTPDLSASTFTVVVHPPSTETIEQPIRGIRKGPDWIYWAWPEAAHFKIQRDRIDLHPIGEPCFPLLRECLLGPVLAMAMQLRGRPVLHGASLALPSGGGCLLLGESGVGKSTLSSLALAAGARLLNEDISVLTQANEKFLLEPGWPVMRLPEERGRALGLELCSEISVTGGDKFAWLVPPERFSTEPVVLEKIFILDRGPHSCVELPPGEALPALLEQVYTRRLIDSEFLQQYFTCFTALLRDIPVRRLTSAEGDSGKAYALEQILC